ncbi:Ku protein [Thermaerobacter sp. PB12/4term]|uniref:non-homologous end joining protein Ku n=1 Tax=Thermaerobacter sp. PB12/4term TaxID=2293838 RepID=UPI000E325B2D|nr:Ku protein [Thermaerobacter sp. PB12/4term]QIA27067.1 Ku protein [Thermaerobacter sp. PB12/4term]
MRSLWRGVISFGLVNIPVRMYLAVEERAVHFRQLHRRCGTPIRYRRWCPRCDVEVQPEELARGYEYAPDRFVLISDEDLAGLPLPTARAVEILDFVRGEDIDPIYFQRTYYLEPAEGGEKAYRLLRRAMDLRGCVAVARVALRNKETLACLRTYRHQALALVAMAYPDEIRPLEALPAYAALGAPEPLAAGGDGHRTGVGPPVTAGGEVRGRAGDGATRAYGDGAALALPGSPDGAAGAGARVGDTRPAGEPPADRELELALHLIDRLTAPFDPGRYRDRYREALLAVVERKLAGREEVVAPPEPAPVLDLMEALRASLEQVEARGGGSGREGGPHPLRNAPAGEPAVPGGDGSHDSPGAVATASRSRGPVPWPAYGPADPGSPDAGGGR